jgi:hypothetical protein
MLVFGMRAIVPLMKISDIELYKISRGAADVLMVMLDRKPDSGSSECERTSSTDREMTSPMEHDDWQKKDWPPATFVNVV